jgi:cytosine/adenosine deaminase-related metal-dependent hydrolase
MVLLVRDATAIYPCQRRQEAPILDGWILIDGQVITAIGQGPLPPEIAGNANVAEEISARGKVVIPGGINLHHHFWQSLTRAVPEGLSATSLSWLRTMYPLWQEIDPASVQASASLAAAELLLTGATTSVDFPFFFPGGQSDLLDVEIEAVRDLGLRLHAVRGCSTVLEGSIERDLGRIPGVDRIRLTETEDEVVAACERTIADYHDGSRFSKCRIGVGPTVPLFRNPDFMQTLSHIAEVAGCERHTHLQPRPNEEEECILLHGCRPTEWLRRIGWLGEKSCVAHCTRHTDEDIRVLAETGSGVAHCPSQNMRLGYPVGPVPEMRAAGVKVGIAVDGASSNDAGSFLGELRLSHMVHRLAGLHRDYGPDTWLTAHDALWMGTREAAAILGRDDVGRLEPGCAADLVLIDLRQIGYAGGLHDPLSTILFSGDTTIVDTTIVGGRVVVEGGRLKTASEARIIDDANRESARLIERVRTRTGLGFGSLAPEIAAACACG